MRKAFSRLPGSLLIVLPWLLLAGCNERQETRLTSSVRQAESAPPVGAPATELLLSQRAFIEVSEKVTPAVVNIRAERVRTIDRLSPLFEEFFGDLFRKPPSEQREHSLGSGFILSEDGYILTNEHVVSGAEQIKVRLTDQRVFPGKVVGSDPKTDVAVIKIEAEEPLPVAVLGDSDRLKVGQWALAIGNPFGLDSTLTVGVISATGRTDVGIEDYENFVQTDASINPGNSGGPLLNIYGEVVGVNTAIVASGQGIGFAIPINLAKLVANQLISSGEVTRGWLGVSIQPLDADLAASFGLDRVTGALVTRVLPGAPAEQAGLRRGDVLLSFDGKPIRSVKELQLLVASSPPGEKIPVEVLREGTRLTLQVAIAVRDAEAQPARQEPGAELTPWLGMSFAENEQGVRVAAVESDSVADNAGVRVGDLVLAINRYAVKSLADVHAARQRSRVKESTLLLLQRGEATLYVALPLKQ
ncbi:MAG: DegQ family serine endoprotease [Desulfuromonadales bacterium]|nr:DegQ family serine endoprotease [Desulfuromonadales bacterium]